MRKLYVPPYMKRWGDLDMQLWGIPGSEDLARIKAPEGVPGLLLVFDSMEALKQHYPDVDESQVLVMTAPEEGS